MKPEPRLLPSAWAQEYRFLADEASDRAGKWNNATAPYLVEILDCMAPWHPARTITLMFCAQGGKSETITNALFYGVDVAPGPIMVVHPTIPAALAWNVEKFEPHIKATKRVAAKIFDANTREGASTQKRKKFPGGYILVVGANSPADLAQHSIRWAFSDDEDQFPADLDKQGDPIGMIEARLTTYERSGRAKHMRSGTPTDKATSRINKAYLAGDQRRYNVPCPHCGHEQVLEWTHPLENKDEAQPPHGLHWKVDDAAIHAWYVCVQNGCIIEEYELDGMLARGRWIAENPGKGRQPSFWLGGLYSPFQGWTAIVRKFLAIDGDPDALKTFINLTLGLPFDIGNKTPAAEVLMKRREEWNERRLPTDRALLITGFADVQGNGIYYEIVAWEGDRTSWSIDVGFLPGDPSTDDNHVWEDLDELRKRTYPDPHGRRFGIDLFGIDSGWATTAVYAWARRHHNTFATKGEDGINRPQIFRTPVAVDRRRTGKLKRFGEKVWILGTFKLKQEVYGHLRKEPPAPPITPETEYPKGYCHFGQHHDLDYFSQLTSERLARTFNKKKGRFFTGWHATGANHFFDCRVGNLAMAYKELIHTWDENECARRLAKRIARAQVGQQDLFEARPSSLSAPAAAPEEGAPERAAVAAEAPAPPPPASVTVTVAGKPANGVRKVRVVELG